MRMSGKCRNNDNNSDNLLISRRTDGGKNGELFSSVSIGLHLHKVDYCQFSFLCEWGHIKAFSGFRFIHHLCVRRLPKGRKVEGKKNMSQHTETQEDM